MKESILIIDNEYENISDLEDLIKGTFFSKFPLSKNILQIVEDDTQAIDFLREIKEEKRDISAIICDNHLSGDLDGDDFLRLLRGYLVYLMSPEERYLGVDIRKINSLEEIGKMIRKGFYYEKYKNYIEENFKDFSEYKDIVNYFHLDRERAIPTVIFCGHPEGVRRFGIEDVPIIQKENGCEVAVLDYLIEEGIFEKEEVYSNVLTKHPRLGKNVSEKKRAYNPNSHRIKVKKKEFYGRRINYD
ncbi:MAG: response regulator [Candidatus Pacearchaeota archaeon]